MTVSTAENCLCAVASLTRFTTLKEWSSLMIMPHNAACHLFMYLGPGKGCVHIFVCVCVLAVCLSIAMGATGGADVC